MIDSVSSGHNLNVKPIKILNLNHYKCMTNIKHIGLKKANIIRTCRIMKVSLLFFILGVGICISNNSYSQSTKLSLHLNNKTINQIFSEIEKNSEFIFFYQDDIIDIDRKVSVNFNNGTIDEILNEVLDATNNTYFISDRSIYIIKETSDKILNEEEVLQQQKKRVTGKVTDKDGEAIIGANIMEKGTTNGTISELDGSFSLNIEPDAVLQITYIGYMGQDINTSGKTTFNIVLQEDTKLIDEVVVVGYGVQRKVTLTGSVSNVDGEKLVESPAISVSNSLAGRLSGIFANNRSGEPGANISNILIRGRSTLGSTSPLFVIDGVWGRSGYNQLDPNEIESITVLKDASAAIYGAQAANGVILITTKRGVDGKKPTFNYTMNYALSQPTRWPEMSNAAEYAQVFNEMLNREGQPDRFSKEEIAKFGDGSDPINYPDTDWPAETFKTFSTQQQHNLSLQGGSNRVKYYMSGSYSNQNSIVKNGIHDYTIIGLRSNIDATVTDNITLSMDLSMNQSDRTRPNQSSSKIFGTTMYNFPWLVAYYPNGLPGPGLERGENPVAMATDDGGYRKSRYSMYHTTFRFDVKIPWVKGLGIDGFAAWDRNNTFNKNWLKPWTVYNYNAITDTYEPKLGGALTKPQLSEESIYLNRLMLNSKLKYDRQFGNHSVNSFVAFEQLSQKQDRFSALRRNYMSESIDELFAGDEQNQVANGTASELARRTFLGRFSYGYMDRYLIDFNFRFDGSSIFPKDRRWGFFPGVSLGWRVSEEEFIKDISPDINNLKIRASWGQMGNDAVSAFQFLSTYTFTSGYFLGSGSDPVKGITHGVSPNPNITWEVQNTYNVGMDLNMWDGLFGLTADFFKQRRNNILTARNASIPNYTGLSLPNENIGIVENKGFEVELSHFNKKGDWQYGITGNFSLAKNKIIDIDEAAAAQPWQRKTGLQMGTSLYYISDGIYRTQEEIDNSPHPTGTRVGDLKYKDYDNDGKISAADRVRLNKTNIPEIIYGVNFSLSYKNLDMSMLLQGQGRAWQYLYTESGMFRNTLHDIAANRYTESNPNSKYPQLASQGGISGYQSTFWLKDASFLRLKNLEIGYTLPETILSKVKMEKLRVYANGFNLLILYDHIKWFDPEATSMAAFYPQNRIINFGLNLTF